jgi:maleate cis-trans isomerase
MANGIRAKLGLVVPRSSTRSSPALQALIPKDVQVQHEGVGLLADNPAIDPISKLGGKREVYLTQAPKMAARYGWHGMAIVGAHAELLNPGLVTELQARVKIPVTEVVTSSIAALKALSVKRVLLMTLFDPELERLLQDRVSRAGIEPVVPKSKPFSDLAAAFKLPPEGVFSFAGEALRGAKGVQALYFQGGLNCVPVLDRMEKELHTPVVCSQVSPIWYLLCKLGLKYKISGGGKLLAQWPALPA